MFMVTAMHARLTTSATLRPIEITMFLLDTAGYGFHDIQTCLNI